MAGPRNVARAVIIKVDDIFCLSQRTGEIPPGNQDGFGIYYHDCRYLSGYELRLSGTSANVLGANAEQGSRARFHLTNNQLGKSGKNSIAPQTFGIQLERLIDTRENAVHDAITIENYDVKQHDLKLSAHFESEFEDIFEIRGLQPAKTGRKRSPKWQDGILVFSYKGADGVNRRMEIHAEPEPQRRSKSSAEFRLHLRGGEKQWIMLSFRIYESRQRSAKPFKLVPDVGKLSSALHQNTRDWLGQYTEVKSDCVLLNEVINRSLRDLGMLKSVLDGCHFFSAGLPWYAALFGRDTIIACLQTLAYEPRIAQQTLRLLAQHQGTKTDDRRDEEPGKILHEFRRGELANLKEIPQTPYYGSVDSTPLFLILLGEYANRTGDLGLFQQLYENVERALRWIDEYGVRIKDRYLAYASKSRKGLVNQGWKDSGHSIMNSDGSLASPPIALVEVQGYVYRAKLLMADLYARSTDNRTADRLRGEAEELKTYFNRDFLLEEKQFYALALQQGGHPAAVISSNPGQALWTGIVDDTRAPAVVRQLMAEDMFSGWGIRTLSCRERSFNPIGYHLGTVWPHDNSILATGFRRYGFDREAATVFDCILHAAEQFEHFRLPEVFAGFSREQSREPVRYPVACHPQAWAAGSVPFMLTSLLGLMPEAFDGRLRVVRPMLPNGVSQLDLRRMKVGDSTMDLRFRRESDKKIAVEITKQTGKVSLEVES